VTVTDEGVVESEKSGGVTVKSTPLLAIPPTVTTTLPVVAPAGTGTEMLVALQLVGIAVVPLNVTVLATCVGPKPVPVMVTAVPHDPDAGFKLIILGITENPTLLLGTPPTLTITLPVEAPAGTGTTILVALQLVAAAAVPLKVTVLVPCDAPKFIPVIVTAVPTGPLVGLKFEMLGPNGVVTLATLEYPLTLPAASLARIRNE